jgi:hypothetical protein
VLTTFSSLEELLPEELLDKILPELEDDRRLFELLLRDLLDEQDTAKLSFDCGATGSELLQAIRNARTTANDVKFFKIISTPLFKKKYI